MKVICCPDLSYEPSRSRKHLVINSILYERLIFEPFSGFFFYHTFPRLAKDVAEIAIANNFSNVSEHLDHVIDKCFSTVIREHVKPIDTMAIRMAIGAEGREKLLCTVLKKNLFQTYSTVRSFYEEKSVKAFKQPYSLDDETRVLSELDAELRKLWYHEYRFDSTKGKFKSELHGVAVVVDDLLQSNLYSPYGYSYIPGHPVEALLPYSSAFLAINEWLWNRVKLPEGFKAYSAETVLNYLLGEGEGALDELLGFHPLDPLELLSKEVSSHQIEEVILKIRKDCRSIRRLFEKVHENCLKKEFDKAIDAKVKLASMNADQSINYSIIDNIGQFIDARIHDDLRELVDRMITENAKSVVVNLHKDLKSLKSKSGWLSEAKFLTFGTLLLLASYGVDSSYLKAVLETLGSAGLGVGGVRVVLRVLEKGMQFHPGFNVYSSFLGWPRIS